MPTASENIDPSLCLDRFFMILVGQCGASQDLSKTIQEIFDERAHCSTHVLAERVHCIYAFGEQV